MYTHPHIDGHKHWKYILLKIWKRSLNDVFLNYSLPVGRRIFNGKYLFSQSTFYTDVTLDSTLTVRRIFWIILRHITKSYNNNVVPSYNYKHILYTLCNVIVSEIYSNKKDSFLLYNGSRWHATEFTQFKPFSNQGWFH